MLAKTNNEIIIDVAPMRRRCTHITVTELFFEAINNDYTDYNVMQRSIRNPQIYFSILCRYSGFMCKMYLVIRPFSLIGCIPSDSID